MYTWGIAGTEQIAEEFIQKLLKTKHRCKVAGVQSKLLSKKYTEVSEAETIDDLLKDKDIAIIYVSTYPDQHQSIIMDALNEGKHVCCEKPMFLNEQDALEAYEVAKQKGLLLVEANTIFYMPLYKELHQKVAEKMIGELKMIRCDFGSLKDEDPNAAVMSTQQGGGALYDIGIYALSVVMNFLGTDIVDKASIMEYHTFGVDERWAIMLKNTKQQLADITLSIRNKCDKRLLIAGDQGFIEVMNFPRADRYAFISPDMSRTEYQVGNSEEAVTYEIQDIEAMIDQQQFGAYRELNCNVMKYMDMIRKENVK